MGAFTASIARGRLSSRSRAASSPAAWFVKAPIWIQNDAGPGETAGGVLARGSGTARRATSLRRGAGTTTAPRPTIGGASRSRTRVGLVSPRAGGPGPGAPAAPAPTVPGTPTHALHA